MDPEDPGSEMIPLSPSRSSPHSPASASPAKAHMRMDSPLSSELVSAAQAPGHTETALKPSITAFPTSRQPVLHSTMKEMLLSLQTSLLAGFSSQIQRFTSDMQVMGDRVQYIESKM